MVIETEIPKLNAAQLLSLNSNLKKLLLCFLISCMSINGANALTPTSIPTSQEADYIESEQDDYIDQDNYIESVQDPIEVRVVDPSIPPAQAPIINDSSNSDAIISSNLSNIEDVPLNGVSPETLRTFVQVIDLVRSDYVEPVSDETLFNDAIYGMLEKLDNHAEFLDATAYDNLRAFTEGDVGHVGLKVQFDPSSSEWVIEDITLDSPAHNADLQVGDYIHQINNTKLTVGMRDTDIVQMLSGIAGTQVDLVVSQQGRSKHTVTLQRNVAQKQQINIEVYNDMAYIKLPVFQNDTATQIMTGLQELDTPITGVVIDVRNNPGGVLNSAIEVASLFMDNADVVQIRGRKTPLRILTTRGAPILKDLPVVLIQNRYSASASEVLASSLQVNNRAIIVGERSYGKGSVQAILPLNDSQAIKLTVAHYYAADGSKIEGQGVSPDIAFLEENTALWQQRALSVLREQDRPFGIIFSRPEDAIPVESDY